MFKKEGGKEQFKNLDKKEYHVLIGYLSKSGIKMRQRDQEGQVIELEDLGEMINKEQEAAQADDG